MRRPDATPSEAPPPLLVCDFDGTLTRRDVGDALCDRFADPSWRQVDEAWLRGEISLPEAQRSMWSTVRAGRDELLVAARELGEFREGAASLFAAVADGRLDLVIASGGFDLYIEPLLGPWLGLLEAAHYNRLEPAPTGARPTFSDAWSCTRCAVCKGRIVRWWVDAGRTVAFCGDGSSDRCAIGEAPRLFAVTGSPLHRLCDEQGIGCVAFESFETVLQHMIGDLR